MRYLNCFTCDARFCRVTRRLKFLCLTMPPLKQLDEQHWRLRTSLPLPGHRYLSVEHHDIHGRQMGSPAAVLNLTIF